MHGVLREVLEHRHPLWFHYLLTQASLWLQLQVAAKMRQPSRRRHESKLLAATSMRSRSEGGLLQCAS